ncbi:uncharacterized protein [Cicer arietinum]|uniref:Uncharacterized protein LOC101495041 isoform X2 n=1 Tax=Cicer arietinum TaxID=3827 RepID=A0A1S2YMT2_CICAR|nr:uncharacterized protein LOC101495041 isoform X2 [Cicer arietinum]
MEGKNKPKGSYSSFSSSEFIGSKESTHPSSSLGVFSSMFSSHSPNVVGRESMCFEVNDINAKETWNPILRTQAINEDGIFKSYGGESHNTKVKELSSIYEDKKTEPCKLSSSNSTPKKDVEENDSENASKGDWSKGTW